MLRGTWTDGAVYIFGKNSWYMKPVIFPAYYHFFAIRSKDDDNIVYCEIFTTNEHWNSSTF